MAVTHDVSSILNDLIAICRDGQNGFELAAGAVDDAALKTELLGYSTQRRDFAIDLQELVSSLGEEPTDSGTVSGAMHRGWMNLRNTVSNSDNYSILAECERGEDAAVEAYRKALDSGLPSEMEPTVQAQYEAIINAHDRVRSLRDMAKGT